MSLADQAAINDFEAQPLSARNLPNSTYDAICGAADRWAEQSALRFFLTPDGFHQSWDWSYRELGAEITQYANAFSALGLNSADVIALILPNLPETHFCIWGGEASAVVMPLNPMLEAGQLVELMRAAGVKALVTIAPEVDAQLWAGLAAHLNDVPSLEHLLLVDYRRYCSPDLTRSKSMSPKHDRLQVHFLCDLVAQQPADYRVDRQQIDARAASSYFCTGGTTGLPKIAVRTHGAEVFDAWALSAALGVPGNGRTYFCGLPLFHVNAQLVTGLHVWMSGGEVILGTPAGYRSEGLIPRFWDIVEHYGVNVFSGVPTIYASLLQQPRTAQIDTLEFAVCGAAPMPAELIRNFEAATGVRILEGYGLTEATCVSSMNPLDGERRTGSIGLRLPYQNMRAVVVDSDGGYERDAAVDEIGVIAVHGPNLFDGYLDDQHNAGAWLLIAGDRWLNTGDLGRQDADGYFWLTGRRKELIIRGGHNIDPKQIEEALAEHPAVSMVAAIGSPDAYAGEVPVAYVQLADGACVSSEVLLSFAAERIPERAAVPKHIYVLERLPTTAVGKLFKPALVQMEVARVLNEQAERNGLVIDASVVQDPKRGLVATLSGPDVTRMRPLLSGYALQVDYVT